MGVGDDLVVLQQVPQELLQGEVLPLPGLTEEGYVNLLLLDEQGQVVRAVVCRPWVNVHNTWKVEGLDNSVGPFNSFEIGFIYCVGGTVWLSVPWCAY